MSRVKPISPAEVLGVHDVPDEVRTVVNKLLVERYDGHNARLFRYEVVRQALAMMTKGGAIVSRSDFFERRWLEFEQLYKEQGWNVVYDKPDKRGDEYEPCWTFTIQ